MLGWMKISKKKQGQNMENSGYRSKSTEFGQQFVRRRPSPRAYTKYIKRQLSPRRSLNSSQHGPMLPIDFQKEDNTKRRVGDDNASSKSSQMPQRIQVGGKYTKHQSNNSSLSYTLSQESKSKDSAVFRNNYQSPPVPTQRNDTHPVERLESNQEHYYEEDGTVQTSEQCGSVANLAKCFSRDDFEDNSIISQTSKFANDTFPKHGETSVTRKNIIIAVRPDLYTDNSTIQSVSSYMRDYPEYDNFDENHHQSHPMNNYREDETSNLGTEHQNLMYFDSRNQNDVFSFSPKSTNRGMYGGYTRTRNTVRDLSPCPGLAMRFKKKSLCKDDKTDDKPQDNSTHYTNDNTESKNNDETFERHEAGGHDLPYPLYEAQQHEQQNYFSIDENPLSQGQSKNHAIEDDIESLGDARNRAFSAFGIALRRVKGEKPTKISGRIGKFQRENYFISRDNIERRKFENFAGRIHNQKNADGRSVNMTDDEIGLKTNKFRTDTKRSFSVPRSRTTTTWIKEPNTGKYISSASMAGKEETESIARQEYDTDLRSKTSTSPFRPLNNSNIDSMYDYESEKSPYQTIDSTSIVSGMRNPYGGNDVSNSASKFKMKTIHTTRNDTGSSHIIRSPSPVSRSNNSVVSHNMRSPSPSGRRYDIRGDQTAYGTRNDLISQKPLSFAHSPKPMNSNNSVISQRNRSPSPSGKRKDARWNGERPHFPRYSRDSPKQVVVPESPKPMGSNSSVASHNMSNMRSPSPSGMRYDQREEEQRAYGPRYSRDSPKPLSNGSNPNRNIRSPSPSPLVRKNTARQDNRTDHTYAPSPSRPAAGYSKPSPSISSSVRSPSPMANRQYSRVQESYGSSENQSNTHSRNIRAPSPSPANHNNANNVYNRQSRDPSHNIETSSAYSSRNVNHTPNKDDYKGYKKNYSSPGLGKRNQSSSRYSAGDSRGPSQYNSAPSVTSTRNFDPEPRDRPESSYPGLMMGQNRMERTHTPSRNGYAPEMRDVEETSSVVMKNEFGSGNFRYSKVKELKSSARFGHLNRSYSDGTDAKSVRNSS